MQNPHLHHFLHALGHQAQHERKQGNTGRANGLLMIGMGIAFMPIPIVGLPLLVMGLCKSAKG